MNNEPVAWMTKDGYVYGAHDTRPVSANIPLYPMRGLTDEEIRKVADEVFKDYKNWHHYQIDFARAILKKASEKLSIK